MLRISQVFNIPEMEGSFSRASGYLRLQFLISFFPNDFKFYFTFKTYCDLA